MDSYTLRPWAADHYCQLYGTSIHPELFDHIGIIDFFERRADASWLPTGSFSLAFRFFTLRKMIRRRRLATITTGKTQAVSHDLHKHQQDFKGRAQSGRQLRFLCKQLLDFLIVASTSMLSACFKSRILPSRMAYTPQTAMACSSILREWLSLLGVAGA